MKTSEKELNEELSQNFLDFSHEANVNRAFADARDGLKPGQRAALWEMYSKGYTSNKPHVKCAKISGGTIASWWPHGSTAVYETFARMSQPWINNIPEVDWHGGNGSVQISADCAADRYTEARLAKSTEDGLFQNIKKQTVPMRMNFSEDAEWPVVLPAIYPRLMVNGCQGIGSTIANIWLPHSLDQLAEIIQTYLASGQLDYSNLAPSFPSGGVIINKDEIAQIYKTGKGKVILRGKAEIQGNNILITEIPYQVYVEPLIEQIKQLVTKEEIKGISNIFNKSNKKRMLIEVECDGTPSAVLAQLFAKTNLQKSYSANQYALVGKTPKLLTFKEYIDIYLQHNFDCIKREHEFDLNKSLNRLEIVEGLVKALEDIDNIIALIKKSDSSTSAIENLKKKYQFTENQAKAIVNMKLGRLAKLEKVELNQEKEELISKIDECKQVIGSNDKQKSIFIKRFTAFVKKYPNPCKTELTQINPESKEEQFIEPEKCVVIMTENGNIKRVPLKSFRTQRTNTKGIKTQDDITSAIIRTDTVDTLMIFSNQGNMYRLSVNDIPAGTNVSKGQSIKSFVPMAANEQPSTIYSIYKDTDAQYVLFATKSGLLKKTSLKEYITTRKKNGIKAIKLKENDEIVSVSLIKDEQLVIITHNGMLLRCKSSEVPASGRVTMGVKGITLSSEDEVVAVMPIRHSEDQLALFTENGLGKRIAFNEIPSQSRGGKGLIGLKKDYRATAVALVNDEDNVLICGNKSSVCISAKDIPILSRTAIGNIIIKDNKILSASKV